MTVAIGPSDARTCRVSLVVNPAFLPVVVLALSACSASTPETPAATEVEASITKMYSQMNDTTITVDCPDAKVRLSSRFDCTATDVSGERFTISVSMNSAGTFGFHRYTGGD